MKTEILLDKKNFIEILTFKEGNSFFVEAYEWIKARNKKRTGKRMFCNKFDTRKDALVCYQKTIKSFE